MPKDRHVRNGRATVRVTKRDLELLDTLVDKGIYNSRADAAIDALRIMYEQYGSHLSLKGKAFHHTGSLMVW